MPHRVRANMLGNTRKFSVMGDKSLNTSCTQAPVVTGGRSGIITTIAKE